MLLFFWTLSYFTSGVEFWFKSGRRPRTSPALFHKISLKINVIEKIIIQHNTCCQSCESFFGLICGSLLNFRWEEFMGMPDVRKRFMKNPSEQAWGEPKTSFLITFLMFHSFQLQKNNKLNDFLCKHLFESRIVKYRTKWG